MSESLALVWKGIEQYLADGISVIPVRDREEKVNGNTKAVKSPYHSWKRFQNEIISKEELWHMMTEKNTSAVSILCGKISGNLEAIDVDVKNSPGVDAELFTRINAIYPELFKRLRIHKTPSGGFHIIYRYQLPEGGKAAGNMKLAYAKDSDKASIETRGEGGYVLAPPSMGYHVHQNQPIPLLTWEEREALIAICKSLNARIKVEKQYTVSKYFSSYYLESPFDDFNHSPAGEGLLLEHGWKIAGASGANTYYTRPGKDAGISASFHQEKRLFYFFTTSTEFKSQIGYYPATVLGIFLFNGNGKKTFTYLAEHKFGKVIPAIEKKVVKTNAGTGKPLPANFSQEAAMAYEQAKQELATCYPFGMFWDTDPEDNSIRIHRDRLIRHVSKGLGFRLFKEQIVRIIGHVLHKVEKRYYFDTVLDYINEINDPDSYGKIVNAWETFIQRSGDATIKRLPLFDPSTVLKSSKNIAYKFYENCFIEITAGHVNELQYSVLHEKKVWSEMIQKRQWQAIPLEKTTQGLYYDFIDKSIGVHANTDHVLNVTGYLAHEFKDTAASYIVVLTERCPDPKDGGGSGKNLFSILLKNTTTFKNIPGSQVKFDKDFLQVWKGERIFSISDIKEKFDWAFLKEMTTGSGIVKYLFKDDISIDSEEMPKFLINTNFSFEISDGGLRRRIIPIEFSDYFTKAGGVDIHYGKMFPDDWSKDEWLAFDNFIVKAIQAWLSVGKLKAPELSEGGWDKQFELNHGGIYTRQFIDENIERWCTLRGIKVEDFNKEYLRFLERVTGNINLKLGPGKMNRALLEYSNRFNIHFEKDVLVNDTYTVH